MHFSPMPLRVSRHTIFNLLQPAALANVTADQLSLLPADFFVDTSGNTTEAFDTLSNLSPMAFHGLARGAITEF